MLCKDPRTVAAGGASEMEISKQLSDFGKKETGLDQYAIAKYAESLEVSTVCSSHKIGKSQEFEELNHVCHLPNFSESMWLGSRLFFKPAHISFASLIDSLFLTWFRWQSVSWNPKIYVSLCCISLGKKAKNKSCQKGYRQWSQIHYVQVVVRAIAENAGLNATEVLSTLRTAHAGGDAQAGLDIETGKATNLQEMHIVDLFSAKVSL